MATSKKITELSQLNTASSSDLLYIVHDPAGSPASQKITVSDLLKNANSVMAVYANAAYTNSIVYANTRAVTAYSNSVAYALSVANTAYNNSTDYTDSVADTLYANVISQANALASNAYSNSIAYFTANPPPVLIEEKYFEYVNGSLNGSGGLGNQFSGLAEDDTQHEIPLPFAVTFLGQTYNSVWIHSNSYLAFGAVNGGDGSPFYPLGPQRLGVPAIMLGSTDRQMTAFYYDTIGTKFIIRYEGVDKNWGGNGASPSRIWEIHFDSENPGEITVLVDGYNIAYSTGVWGIHDGVRWADIFEPLPYFDQNNDTIYYGLKISYNGTSIAGTLKFIGAGVEAYTEGDETYIVSNPLHNLLNIDLNDSNEVIVGAAYYGVQIKSAHDGRIFLNSSGNIDIRSGNGTPATPGNGYNIEIKAGNAYSNGATGYNGGNVNISAGIGSNGGSNGIISLNGELVLSNNSVINSGTYSIYIKPSNSYVNILGITPTGDYDIHLYEAATDGAIALGNYGATNFRVYGPGGANGGGGQYGNDIRAELYGNSTFTITSNNGNNVWRFDDSGYLSLPAGGTIGAEGMGWTGISSGASQLPVSVVYKTNTGIYQSTITVAGGDDVDGEGSIIFDTYNANGATYYHWVFTNNTLTFPDSTVQNTAYTGVKAVALVNTTAYSANSSEEILLCDPNAAGNNITVTLPNTAANGKVYTIKNINDGGYDVYVEANGQPNIIELHGAGTFNTYDNISQSGNVVSWVYYDGYYRVISSS